MIVSWDTLAKLCAEFKEQYKQIVFTNGCFDIIHSGHISYLNQAKNLGDILIIGLNTDNSVKRLKGKSRPINSELDRAVVLSALKCVDYVVLFDEDTPEKLIMALKPNILVKGGDYTPEQIAGADFVIRSGGKVEIIPYVTGKSTTAIIGKIAKL